MKYEQFAVIDPITVTPAILTSTNVAETDAPAYAAGTTYAIDTLVMVASEHNIYKSLANTNTGHTPSTSPTWWVLVGKTNAWKMFDGQVNTQTSNATSIVATLHASQIVGGLALLNVDADSVTVTMTDPVDGVVYNKTVTADRSSSGSSFYRWCFGKIRRRTQFIFADFPPYFDASVTVTISKPGGTAKCGVCVLGPLEAIGLTKFGVSPGIKDYSSNLFDQFGNFATVERAWAKTLNVDVMVENDLVDDVQALLASYRARMVVWIASTGFESTALLARYSNFKVVIPNAAYSDCSLTLDGSI